MNVDKKITLTARQIELLEYLISEHKPIKCEEIASKLNISTRTILNEIKYINESTDGELQILVKRGHGYYLSDCTIDLSKYSDSLNNLYDIDYRTKKIIEILISKNTYITLQDIADKLYTSKQTISNDMKIVKDKLQEFNLNVIRKPSYGIKIKGSERDIRKCISYCYSLMENNIYEITEYEKHLFSSIDLKEIYQITCDFINHKGIMVSNGFEKLFSLHVAISYLRIKKNMIMTSGSIDEKYHEESEECLELIQLIEKKLNINFNYNEKIYLSTYYISGIQDKMFNSESLKKKLCHYLIDKGYDYMINDSFINCLVLHLSFYEKRFTYGIALKNPLLSEIKKKYFYYFEQALKLMQYLYPVSNKFDENEIAYIALHFANGDYQAIKNKGLKVLIICAAGICSGQIVEKIILNNFKQFVKYIEVISYRELNDMDIESYDIVFTSIQLTSNCKKIVHINLIPSIDELSFHLNNTFDKMNNESAYHDLFTKELFYVLTENISKNDVIDLMCYDLTKCGYAKSNMKEYVMKREQISSTCISKYIAIPHSLYPCTIKPSISVLVTEKGLKWDGEIVKIVILINANEDNAYILGDFYNDLINILDNYNYINKVSRCKNFEEFMSITRF